MRVNVTFVRLLAFRSVYITLFAFSKLNKSVFEFMKERRVEQYSEWVIGRMSNFVNLQSEGIFDTIYSKDVK